MISREGPPDSPERGAPFVSLVGAGPGAPDLVTVRGLDRIRRADVIVHDDLVHPDLLTEAAPHAEVVYAGKRGWRADAEPRPDTGDLLVRAALEGGGRRVVRLKGGDPMIFGRGGEETAALAAAGIPFEVVPGVTAAMAAGATAGIPLTLRGVSSSVTFVTGASAAAGAGSPDDPTPRVPVAHLAAFARAGGTLAVYMGLRALPDVADSLRAHRVLASTPVAVVSGASGADERVVTGDLTDIAGRAAAAGLPSPALVIIGEVVAHRREPSRLAPREAP